MARPTGRYLTLPLDQLLTKKKVQINAPYFRVESLGSPIEIFFEDSQSEGTPVTTTGKVFCVDPGNPDEWFTEILISNAQVGEGELRLFISPNIRVDDGFSAAPSEQGRTLLGHFVSQGPTGAIRLRNLLMTSVSAATDFASNTATYIDQIVGGDYITGIKVGNAAGAAAASGRLGYMNWEAPLPRYMNARAGVAPPTWNEKQNEYFEIEDTCFGRVVNGGGGGRAYVGFGMGRLFEDLGAMTGEFVGFYCDLASANQWRALVHTSSGGGGAGSVLYNQPIAGGYDHRIARKLRVRLGIVAGIRCAQLFVNDVLAHTIPAPMASPMLRYPGVGYETPQWVGAKTTVAEGAEMFATLGSGARLWAVTSDE